MMPNRVKRGPHHHRPRQNWLGSVMKRYFVHISLIGAKWIPKSFIPQKAFCNALAASELRNRNMSPSTQDSSMALLTPFVPYSLQYNMHRPNSKDILILFLFSSCSHIPPTFLFQLEYKQSLSVSRPSHYCQYHTHSQALSV